MTLDEFKAAIAQCIAEYGFRPDACVFHPDDVPLELQALVGWNYLNTHGEVGPLKREGVHERHAMSIRAEGADRGIISFSADRHDDVRIDING